MGGAKNGKLRWVLRIVELQRDLLLVFDDIHLDPTLNMEMPGTVSVVTSQAGDHLALVCAY